MATIYFVRHGMPSAAFDTELDPGLDPTGQRQAEGVAEELASQGPLPIVASPLARARETAEPLVRRWKGAATIEPRVAELPSPTQDLAERAAYVRSVMAGRWSAAETALWAWRAALLECVRRFESDCVVFSHFIAINAVVGAATGDERVIVFTPDHASVTTVVTGDDGVVLAALGREADTGVR